MLKNASSIQAKLRSLPQIQRLLETSEVHALADTASRAEVVAALREVLDEERAAIRKGSEYDGPPGIEDIIARARTIVVERRRPALRRVINATGIVLHTNLGRAPLPEAAIDAVSDIMRGYMNLEFDLESGTRGSRMQPVETLLRHVTGAEAGIAVNNAAAAMLLSLSALACGKEVIVSRGELIEIGGGFRIPEIIQQGGARLVEIGTTNKTRLSDYRDAITPETRVILKVHRSNFRMSGFTAEADIAELAQLARERNLILLHDLGSGALVDFRLFERPHEPTLQDSIRAGVDLAVCSGDKLMGGPQAGIVAGRSHLIEQVRKHPLLRAVRLDKMSLTALEATLRLYRDPGRAVARIPVLRMLAQKEADLKGRARRLCGLLERSSEVAMEPSTGYAGGGTLPCDTIPSWAVHVRAPVPASELSRRMRLHHPAVVGRIEADHLLLDMLTVADDELPDIATAVQKAVET